MTSSQKEPLDIQQQLVQLSKKLAENQQRFEAVLSGMVEGVIAVDEQCKLLFLNQAARTILSIDLPDVTDKPLIGLVRYEPVLKATREALDSNRIVHTTFQTYERNRRDVRLRVAPMAGQPLPGLTLVFHDVTELNRLETIRRDFVANVSHELKTPLSSIKANAETLLMGAIDRSPDNRRFVQQIERQADTLNQQIHDLLQLARIESGRQVFNSRAVELLEVCTECVLRHMEDARRKDVELTLVDQTEGAIDHCVWADPDSLRTIFDNLISNAIRYSHHHGTGKRRACVQVEIKNVASQLVVKIVDNGIGIALEHQSRIFERFFRVDPARSRELGGTGLGLSIVKHLVQSFGGHIEVQSKLGVGSTFRIEMPCFRQQK